MALSVDEAARIWLAAVRPLPATDQPVESALGLVLAAAVAAPHDLPPFARAMMDGYAVRLGDAGQSRPVAGAVHAGDDPRSLPRGAVLAIMTGAPVPDGAEAVVPREDCTVAGGVVALPAALRAGANIVPRGGEAAAGATVLRAGCRVGPLAVAAAAALGLPALPVVPRPRVAILTTGSELAAAGAELRGGAIRDSNGPMLGALCGELGVAAQRATVPDDPAALAAAIAASPADLIILTGGVSAGDRDHVPDALAAAGFRALVRGVDQKPGKPLLLAAAPGRLAAALPGNPLAVHWCFVRFVAPALRTLMGSPPGPARETAVLTAPLPAGRGRPWYIPVATHRAGGRLVAQPLIPASSGDVAGPAHADAYALAAGQAAGNEVEVIR